MVTFVSNSQWEVDNRDWRTAWEPYLARKLNHHEVPWAQMTNDRSAWFWLTVGGNGWRHLWSVYGMGDVV